MTTATFSTVSSTDSGYITRSSFSNTDSDNYLGYYSSAQYSSFVRIPSVSIPNSSDVSSFKIKVRCSHTYNYAAADYKIYAVAADNASSPTSLSEYNGLTLTTAYVSGSTQILYSGTYYELVDISSVVEEVISRPGWVSGNSIVFVIKNNSTGSNTLSSYYAAASGAPTNRPSATATWTSTVTTPADLSWGIETSVAVLPAWVGAASSWVSSASSWVTGQSSASVLSSATAWRIQAQQQAGAAWKLLAGLGAASAWAVASKAVSASSWRVLASKASASAWNILNWATKDVAWKILSAASTVADTSWKIFAASSGVASWRISALLSGSTSWRCLAGAAKDIAWAVLQAGAASATVAWRVMARFTPAVAWRILAQQVVDSAWAVMGLIVSAAAVSWRIFGLTTSGTSWRVLASKSADTAWAILGLTFTSAATSWAIFSRRGYDASWRVLAGIQSSSAWTLFTRLARALGWQIGIVPLGPEVIRLSCPITRTISHATTITRTIRLRSPISE